jgi:glycerophosphoryl diester phosphodiesterase
VNERSLAAFRRRVDGAVRVTGHRGVRREGGPAENTIAAFDEAADARADAIELDVRLAKDGEPVVLHDETLARVTSGLDPRAATDLSARELGRVDLGGGATVPTLAHALEHARGRRLAVNVELKRDVPDRAQVVRNVARLLATWDARHAVLVSSFDPAMLALFAAQAPAVPRALLVHRTWYRDLAARGVAPALAHAAHVERVITTPALVRALRRSGLVVQVWTVNHGVEAKDLDALGVDGLITDAPGELRAALA